MATDSNPQGSVTKTDLSVLKSELKIEIIEQNTKLFVSIAVLLAILGLIFLTVIFSLVVSLRP